MHYPMPAHPFDVRHNIKNWGRMYAYWELRQHDVSILNAIGLIAIASFMKG